MGNRPLNILVLSFYYRPDLSAGSFRVTPLVEALRRAAPANSRVDIITTLPNRYHSFSAEAPEKEDEPGGTVWRVALPAHRSGMADQSRAFLAFARGVLRRVGGKQYDAVFASSSRLMTALLAAEVSRRMGAVLYLDIRDIFADTIKDVLSGATARIAGTLASGLEHLAVNRASKVSLVSGGFLPYFTARYPNQRFECFTNGVDDEFLAAGAAPTALSSRRRGTDPVTVLYAGNIGEGQGLHLIVPSLAQRLGSAVHFDIVGDGGRRPALEAALTSRGVRSVALRPPVPREQLISAYRDADVLFLHLNDYEAFEKVLPSKIFEYAAMGKPIWAGVGGFAAEFLRKEVSNVAIFPPGDLEAALTSFPTLVLEDTPRPGFVSRFARGAITDRLARDIVSTVGGSSRP
jgi:glycosyltransferase involved in cell wall biosynthesis